MRVHLLPHDRVPPRPIPHLACGVHAFVCALCGEPVFLTPSEPPADMMGEKKSLESAGATCTAFALPIHPDCRRVGRPDLVAQLTHAAMLQRTWEARALLN